MDGGEDSGRGGRRWVVIAIALLTAVLVASGVGYAATRRTTPRGPSVGPVHEPGYAVLHVAWTTGDSPNHQVGALDPSAILDASSAPIVNLLYDGLFTVSPAGSVEPWGADHVLTSPDGLTYTFHLRPGQLYSDGTPVHASDYAGTISRSLNPCLASSASLSLLAIEGAAAYARNTNCSAAGRPLKPLPTGVIAADDSAGTLRIRLAQPSGYFLAALASPAADAIEPSVLGGNYGIVSERWTTNLVATPAYPTGQGGSGMFYLSQERAGTPLVLKANPYWWGRAAGKKPYLTEIDFFLFPNADAAYRAYDDGTQFDYIDGVTRSEVETSPKPPDLHVVPALTTEWVLFNWQRAPLTNLDARLALCLAIDRDTLASDVASFPYAGNLPAYGAPLPSWHLVPQGMLGYNASLTGIDGVTATTGDLTRARAHWAAYIASPHGAPTPRITYYYDQNRPRTKVIAEQIVAQWNAAFGPGTAVAKTPREVVGGNPIQGSIQQSTQATTTGWFADYLDPQDFLVLPFALDTYDGINVPAANALVARAEAAPDAATRLSLYQQAEQALVQQVAACPLFQDQHAYRVRSYIHNLVENGLGMVPLDTWAKVYITNP